MREKSKGCWKGAQLPQKLKILRGLWLLPTLGPVRKTSENCTLLLQTIKGKTRPAQINGGSESFDLLALVWVHAVFDSLGKKKKTQKKLTITNDLSEKGSKSGKIIKYTEAVFFCWNENAV